MELCLTLMYMMIMIIFTGEDIVANRCKKDLERNVREIEEERILLRALVSTHSSGSKSRSANKQSKGRRRSEGNYKSKKQTDVQR